MAILGKVGQKSFWMKVGLAVIGVALIIAGIVAVLKPAAENVASRAVPV
jgi:uncharacterized membrane protein HdeD (DUF308 family)